MRIGLRTAERGDPFSPPNDVFIPAAEPAFVAIIVAVTAWAIVVGSYLGFLLSAHGYGKIVRLPLLRI